MKVHLSFYYCPFGTSSHAHPFFPVVLFASAAYLSDSFQPPSDFPFVADMVELVKHFAARKTDLIAVDGAGYEEVCKRLNPHHRVFGGDIIYRRTHHGGPDESSDAKCRREEP